MMKLNSTGLTEPSTEQLLDGPTLLAIVWPDGHISIPADRSRYAPGEGPWLDRTD
jgi:hypothetical protein